MELMKLFDSAMNLDQLEAFEVGVTNEELVDPTHRSRENAFMDTIFDFDSLDPVDPDTEQGNQFQGPVAKSSSSTWRPCDLVL